ncbi:uncharacterized protein AAEQ78_027928 isoform 8-T8 [Lycaon pictus]
MMNTPMPSPGPAQGSVLIPCFPSLKGVTANQGPRVYFICAHLHLIVPQTHVPLRTHHGQHRAVLRCLSALEPLYAHQAGSPVEPQEDADLSLCRVTDHHGFLQEKELPGPSPHEAKQKMPGDLESRQADAWKHLQRGPSAGARSG